MTSNHDVGDWPCTCVPAGCLVHKFKAMLCLFCSVCIVNRDDMDDKMLEGNLMLIKKMSAESQEGDKSYHLTQSCALLTL